MTPESAARVLRCIGATASEWRDEVCALLDVSKAEADRQRKARSPDALRALALLAARTLEGARCMGGDPGKDGYLVASNGLRHVTSWRLGALYHDEAPDGPAARRRHNARLAAGELPKGSRKRDPSKGDKARNRIDVIAGGFVADVVRSTGLPVWIEGVQFRPGVYPKRVMDEIEQSIAEGLPRYARMKRLMTALAEGESAQSAATTGENHGRLVGLFRVPHERIISPAAWQAGWTDEASWPELQREGPEGPYYPKRYHLIRDPAGARFRPVRETDAFWQQGMRATKVRSILAAKRAGLVSLRDGECDAFHISTFDHRRTLAQAIRAA